MCFRIRSVLRRRHEIFYMNEKAQPSSKKKKRAFFLSRHLSRARCVARSVKEGVTCIFDDVADVGRLVRLAHTHVRTNPYTPEPPTRGYAVGRSIDRSTGLRRCRGWDAWWR